MTLETENNPPAKVAPPTAPTEPASEQVKYAKEWLKERNKRTHAAYKMTAEEVSIDDKIRNRRKELENDAFEQDIKLKKSTLERLFIFLGSETIVIFLFALLQGLRLGNFALEEWSFKLLVAATITQITTMLLVAVKHLFPQKK